MSVIKNIFQLLLGEKKDENIVETDSFTINNGKKIKKTSQVVNKLEKGNNGIFGDEYEADYMDDEEKYMEEARDLLMRLSTTMNYYRLIWKKLKKDDSDDDTNYRDKDKEARLAYIEKVRKSLIKMVKKMGKYGTTWDKIDKTGKYTRTSDRSMIKENKHYVELKVIKLKQRILRANKRKLIRKRLLSINLMKQRNRIKSLLRVSRRHGLLKFLKISKKLKKAGVLIKKNKLMKLVLSGKMNIKKAKKMSKKAKVAKKAMSKAKKFQKLVEAQRKQERQNGIEM